jgi:AcrR family transcriptional regulator
MMKKQRKDAQETRRRLLEAASEVFAEKGFWEATHQEICRKAKANTAAVNYHFGSKENLYVEAWRYSLEKSIEAHPFDGGIASDAPVEERLRGWFASFMQRMADPGNHEVEIMHREMANPTGLLKKVLPQAMEPMRQWVRRIIREILGPRASEQQVSLCEMSFMGQCFGPMLHLRHSRMGRGAPHPGGPLLESGVDDLADHVTRFTLAGFAAVRQQTRTGPKRGRKRRPGHRSTS